MSDSSIICAEIANDLRNLANKFDKLGGVPAAFDRTAVAKASGTAPAAPAPAAKTEADPLADEPSEKPEPAKRGRPKKEEAKPAPAPEAPKADPAAVWNELKGSFVKLIGISRDKALAILKATDPKAAKLSDVTADKHGAMLAAVQAELDGNAKKSDTDLV